MFSSLTAINILHLNN